MPIDSIDIEILKDATCNLTPSSQAINHVDFSKQDIFNYGVFHYEIPPEKIGENDFDYLESKIPAYVLMYEDHVKVSTDNNSIECHVTGEAAKNVSEIVGIAAGLKAAIKIFNIEKKDIEKIGLSGKKEKRLDFKANINGQEIQIETKGTTYETSVKGMLDDIHAKKEGKDNIVNKFGFVTLFSKLNELKKTQLFMTDPTVEPTENPFDGIYKFINYYLIYFSFILDNVEYNKIYQRLHMHNFQKTSKNIIKIKKIKYDFTYRNKTYVGQCFDKRLLVQIIDKHIKYNENKTSLFSRLTESVGTNKYFLGIDKNILESINKNNIQNLSRYSSENFCEIHKEYEYIQMSDGIILIISRQGALQEMEEKFTEEKVKKRLNNFQSFIQRSPHKCGASCRSKGIEGKPCDILTYREHCRYHR